MQGLLTVIQLVMNSWEKDAFRSRAWRRHEAQGSAHFDHPTKRTHADAPSNPDHLKETLRASTTHS